MKDRCADMDKNIVGGSICIGCVKCKRFESYSPAESSPSMFAHIQAIKGLENRSAKGTPCAADCGTDAASVRNMFYYAQVVVWAHNARDASAISPNVICTFLHCMFSKAIWIHTNF